MGIEFFDIGKEGKNIFVLPLSGNGSKQTAVILMSVCVFLQGFS